MKTKKMVLLVFLWLVYSVLVFGQTGALNIVGGVVDLSGAIISGIGPISTSSANNNYMIGTNAGSSITTAKDTVCIGSGACQHYTGDGSGVEDGHGVMIGFNAGNALTTGSHNTFLGQTSGLNTTTGNHNTYVGSHSGTSVSGSNNAILGVSAGEAVNTNVYAGDNNTILGEAAGQGNGAKNNVVFIGALAGHQSTADNNVYVGYGAGQNAVTSTGQIAIGYQTGLNMTGNNNTAIGYLAAQGLTVTGTDNTILGYNAGQTMGTGSRNVIIGSGANLGSNAHSNAINIGYGVTSVNSNSVNIGNSSNASVTMYGKMTLTGFGQGGGDGGFVLGDLAGPAYTMRINTPIGQSVNSFEIANNGVVKFSIDATGAVTFSTDINFGANTAIFGSAQATRIDQNGLSFKSSIGIGWSATIHAYDTLDTGIYRAAIGVVAIGNGTAADTTGTLKYKIELLQNAVAVASLPTCASGTLGSRQLVNNATVATPGSTATGGGTFTIAVQCTFNSTGSVYTWIID